MPNIHQLDQALINKIAAGEVVERPASVVKELVENALDAHATDIAVELEEGGTSLIRISDNGEGMTAEDAKLAVRRHATSKIRSVQDLQAIETLGFRGEALAAISSVSQFRLVTRPVDSVGAVEVSVKDGEIQMKEAAGKEGTMVEVKGLFDMVPARKKFLKTANTEFKHIVDMLTRQALLRPDVAWSVSHNGKQILNYPKTTTWQSRIASVLGPDLSSGMIEMSHQRGSFILHGFLGHPSVARERLTDQYLFVNKRAVQDFMIGKAAQQGYDTLIARGFKPAFVLHCTIAPDLVDVNVHPRKAEVKFADPSSVYREVYHAVKNALGDIQSQEVSGVEERLSRGGDITDQQTFKTHRHKANSFVPRQNRSASEHVQQLFFQNTASVTPSVALDSGHDKLENEGAVGSWKLIGQSHNNYLLVEENDALVIIDQHAAAERVLLEKLLADKQDTSVQQLLVPLVFNLSPKQWSIMQEQVDALNELGVEGEEFGKQTFRLTGIPQDVDVSDIKGFFLDLLEEISESAGSLSGSLEQRRVKLAQMTACKAAVKFHQPLDRKEQIQLLKDIHEYNAVSCCHGRPTIYRYGLDELNKQFHRH